MSLFGAMFSGISGLTAQSLAMGAIADNITNMNTVGYKATNTAFSTLVTAARTTTTYSPGGVDARPLALIDRQGLLQASSSPTDIAMSGNGFFVVNTLSEPTTTSGTYMFTRAGAFTSDQDGFLKNPAGFYLQGWAIDDFGNIPTNRTDLTALGTVNVSNLTGSAQQTTSISLKANLQSSQVAGVYAAGDISAGNVTPHFETSLDVFDSLGGTKTLNFGFFRDQALPANQWRVEIYAVPASDVTNTNGLVDSGILAFNTDGSFDAANTTLPSTLNITTWNPILGIDDSTLQLGLGSDGETDGVTQFDAGSVLISADINGAVFGSLAGISISEDGIVTALFDNGSQKDIFQLPVATFANSNGLVNRPGNAWTASFESGNFNLLEAGIGGAGKISPSTLEASTVDLATEFTKMIITQRAYSASSRIITTADDMLEELIRLKR